MNSQQLELMIKRSPTLEGDRALRHAISALNEENQDLKRAIKECGEVINQLSDILNDVLKVNMNMKDRIDKQFRPDDGLDPSTKMIGDAG